MQDRRGAYPPRDADSSRRGAPASAGPFSPFGAENRHYACPVEDRRPRLSRSVGLCLHRPGASLTLGVTGHFRLRCGRVRRLLFIAFFALACAKSKPPIILISIDTL